MKRHKNGFTLIEILVVLGLIAILASVVLIAVNPARQFAQGRNAQRESSVNTLLNALGQNLADNKGVFTCAGMGTTPSAIATHIGVGSGNVNLACLVPTYIPSAIPMDPTNGTADDTQYTIAVDTTGRYIICAPGHAEVAISGSVPFCITR